MKIRAILFGATGMVGEGVLRVALRHAEIESVLVIGRRECNVRDRKIHEILHKDFYDYTAIEKDLGGYNACFFCLGVTSIGKGEDEYRRLTYDLTMSAARVLSRLNPDMTFCYVSGMGTDSSEAGRSMWARVKGKTENHLMKLPFKAAYGFRPGYIKPLAGQENAYRASEILGVVYPALLALFPKYVCTMEDLGLAMIEAAGYGFSGRVLENQDIARLARSNRERTKA